MLARRVFIKSSGMALVSLGLAPSFLQRIAAAESAKRGKILVTIFQRGAADGLNIVVPFAEQTYYSMRPTIAIPSPVGGNDSCAIDLDGFFGFHPAMRPLFEIYKSGHLAAIHATGSPDNTRSHFDAQDFMESTTPGIKGTRDGWLNRYLSANPAPAATPFRAVSLTANLPRSLEGPASAIALQNLGEFAGNPNPNAARWKDALRDMYEESGNPALRAGGEEAFDALDFLEKAGRQRYQPAAGISYPRGPLGNSMRQIAQLIRADAGIEFAFAETGGWDHHANEGSVQGQLAARLRELSDSLSAFYQDLGDRMEDIVVLIMSEFERTARENGNRGTDHGHANVMLVMGGPVIGGKVYGEWPGLAREQLNEGRDLRLTTDFRDVFGEIVTAHLGLNEPAAVFPNYRLDKKAFRKFLRA